jgi:hypothetical protein
VFNVRLARLVMMDDAMAPAEARVLAATRETTADPLETLPSTLTRTPPE